MTPLRGIVPPIITPFSPDGRVDVPSLDRLVDHLLDHGVDGLFVLGSTGQVAYLTDDERAAVLGRVVDRTAGRVPILVGVPELSGRRAADAGRRAIAAGADAVVATAPMYALIDDEELGRHFRIVAEAVGAPVFAYDIPVRVHRKLDNDLLLRLGRDGVIAGVKDSSGDDDNFVALVAANDAASRPLQLLTGHEIRCEEMFRAGADGAVPGLANVDPAGYVRMWKAAQAGDWATVAAEQARLKRLFDIVVVPQGHSLDSRGIGAFKAALACLGVIDSATMPDPLSSLTTAEVAEVQAVLAEVGLHG